MGDLSVRAPVWANDEIGELGRAFNAMIISLDASHQELARSNDQLKQRNQELAVLYELAHMANEPGDMQQIIQYGLAPRPGKYGFPGGTYPHDG